MCEPAPTARVRSAQDSPLYDAGGVWVDFSPCLGKMYIGSGSALLVHQWNGYTPTEAIAYLGLGIPRCLSPMSCEKHKCLAIRLWGSVIGGVKARIYDALEIV